MTDHSSSVLGMHKIMVWSLGAQDYFSLDVTPEVAVALAKECVGVGQE